MFFTNLDLLAEPNPSLICFYVFSAKLAVTLSSFSWSSFKMRVSNSYFNRFISFSPSFFMVLSSSFYRSMRRFMCSISFSGRLGLIAFFSLTISLFSARISSSSSFHLSFIFSINTRTSSYSFLTLSQGL